MYNVLIVHGNSEFPIRATTKERIYSFRNYTDHRCFFMNALFCKPPSFLRKINFDLIIFESSFTGIRWDSDRFIEILKRLDIFKEMRAVKTVLAQDEFLNTDVLCDFINDFRADCVFSVSPESEWPKIYHKVNREKVKIYKVLTGYLDDEMVDRIRLMPEFNRPRPLDVGCLIVNPFPWLGRHGQLKKKVADMFKGKALSSGLKVEISTPGNYKLFGDDWYRFLMKFKYFIGAEGGSSILDRDGSIKRRTEEYTGSNPNASFEEIEAACFPGIDGGLNLHAIGPRNLEACATKTCQVLVEGHYDEILDPGVHYIEIRKDFSNIDEVIGIIKEDKLREGIVERAYRDIVESGKYSYRLFVEQVIEKSIGQREASEVERMTISAYYYALKVLEAISALQVVIISVAYRAFLKMPRRFQHAIRKHILRKR